MLTLLIAMILVVPMYIVLLRSYEYEGDSKMVAYLSAILHGVFAVVFCLAWLILITSII